MNNLPCGYFRDLQIIKEVFLPAFEELKDCLRMTAYIINKIQVNEHILDDPKYDNMFSVEEVNRLARADAVPRCLQESGTGHRSRKLYPRQTRAPYPRRKYRQLMQRQDT